MKKKRHVPQPPKEEPASPPSGLVRRLLDGLRRRQLNELPPAGQRSGEGTESLAPYLEQGRNSRPAPLE
ncbi:hypothetical protein [Ramlibacter sp. Leaf400]|uniref:hypothetical protein n=1 Tax=Ramlibacter sp. Leaf400 TaxID=1736365 RepID=UPI0006F6662A|nr:hypothetical protein [Ramlibacter sp. Leaf400]KQT07591.1 hypothetical protein ASG30_17310 [Ramlibacter sp. Leaf400]